MNRKRRPVTAHQRRFGALSLKPASRNSEACTAAGTAGAAFRKSKKNGSAALGLLQKDSSVGCRNNISRSSRPKSATVAMRYVHGVAKRLDLQQKRQQRQQRQQQLQPWLQQQSDQRAIWAEEQPRGVGGIHHTSVEYYQQQEVEASLPSVSLANSISTPVLSSSPAPLDLESIVQRCKSPPPFTLASSNVLGRTRETEAQITATSDATDQKQQQQRQSTIANPAAALVPAKPNDESNVSSSASMNTVTIGECVWRSMGESKWQLRDMQRLADRPAKQGTLLWTPLWVQLRQWEQGHNMVRLGAERQLNEFLLQWDRYSTVRRAMGGTVHSTLGSGGQQHRWRKQQLEAKAKEERVQQLLQQHLGEPTGMSAYRCEKGARHGRGITLDRRTGTVSAIFLNNAGLQMKSAAKKDAIALMAQIAEERERERLARERSSSKAGRGGTREERKAAGEWEYSEEMTEERVIVRARRVMKKVWGDDWENIDEKVRETWRREELGEQVVLLNRYAMYSEERTNVEDEFFAHNNLFRDRGNSDSPSTPVPTQHTPPKRVVAGDSDSDQPETMPPADRQILVPVLPPSVLNLASTLTNLSLGRNKLRGCEISEVVCTLTSLHFLDLSCNQLRGVIPEGIGKLRVLEELYLDHNLLTGPIPQSLWKCRRLRRCDLSNNSLSGALPGIPVPPVALMAPATEAAAETEAGKPISKIVSRTQKRQSKKQRAPELPLQLEWLRLGGNDGLGSSGTSGLLTLVDGALATMRDYPASSTALALAHCGLVDDGDDWVGILPQLRVLHCPGNRTLGELDRAVDVETPTRGVLSRSLGLPQRVGLLHLLLGQSGAQSLVELVLSDNGIGEGIPPALGRCKSLQVLDLSHNQLLGPLPLAIVGEHGCTHLRALDLSHNRLRQSLPPEMGTTLLELEILRLEYNQFTGALPPALLRLPRLVRVTAQCNRLGLGISGAHRLRGAAWGTARGRHRSGAGAGSGAGSGTGSGTGVCGGSDSGSGDVWEVLVGYGTSLLSSSWSSTLLWVDFSQQFGKGNNNGLGGSFPEVPETVANGMESSVYSVLNNLHALRLGHNSLSGSLPVALFAHCTTLQQLCLPHNHIGGILPDPSVLRVKFSSKLRVLDLSANQIKGSLSPSLFCHASLPCLARLDLHANLLSGHIPSSFGSFTLLEHLDLSRNSLSGRLPVALTGCEMLSTLLLAHNKLGTNTPARSQSRSQSCCLGDQGSSSSSSSRESGSDNGVPNWVWWKMPLLQILDLGANCFTGELQLNRPPSTAPSQKGATATVSLLRVLILRGNRLKDSLPTNTSIGSGWHRVSGLRTLDLAHNKFTGDARPLVAALSCMKELQQLDLRGNSMFFQTEAASPLASCLYDDSNRGANILIN